MVLLSKVVPPDILQTLLNLAEFMEHEVEVSPAGCRIIRLVQKKDPSREVDVLQHCRPEA